MAEMTFLLFGLFLLSLLLANLERYLEFWQSSALGYWFYAIIAFLLAIWPYIQIALWVLAVISVYMIISNLRKLNALVRLEDEIYKTGKPISVSRDLEESAQENTRWKQIQELMSSSNSSDWHKAIIDADEILASLLSSKGYHGDSIGEMLKSADKGDFLSIESAWSAHKTRNKIAHPDPNNPVGEREARLAMSHFESVFKEFELI